MARHFDIEECKRFVRSVDAELSGPCALVLVGESALSLSYSPDRAILDLEVWSTTDRVIWTAAERASEKIPRPIHLRPATLAQPGMSFESRVQPSPIDGLRLLKVLVPEPHDQVLLCAARGVMPSALAELHRNHPLSLSTLVERYQEFEREVSMPRERLKASFLAAVSHMYGEAKTAGLERELGERPRQRPSPP